MRCNTVLRLLDDHVDGLLPARRAESMRRHLDGCESCRTEADAVRAATTPLSAWGDLEPPAACFESILARIEDLPEEARDRGAYREPRVLRPFQWLVTGSMAAAAAVLLGVALGPAAPTPLRLNRTPALSGTVVSTPFGVDIAAPVVGVTAPSPFLVPESTPVFSDGVRSRPVFVSGDDATERAPAGFGVPYQEGPR